VVSWALYIEKVARSSASQIRISPARILDFLGNPAHLYATGDRRVSSSHQWLEIPLVGVVLKNPRDSVMPIATDCRFMPCETAPRRERMPGGQVVEEMTTWHG
jgi:hypothetical protein